MILFIDNYDSFTYNLVQYLGELVRLHPESVRRSPSDPPPPEPVEIRVVRNDEITVEEAIALNPTHIVISPGPCTPTEAGISIETILKCPPTIPVLGVCLGHQSLGQAMGGVVERAPYLMHGKTSLIHHEGKGVFAGLSQPFEATRYHSLIVRREGLPDSLEITAWTEDGLIMGMRHKERPIEGVQFHPESIMTAEGKKLLANFLAM